MNQGIEDITSEFHFHRRDLPHWQVGGSSYFVTFRSAIGVLSDAALEVIKRQVQESAIKYFELHFVGVIMPDHVHLLFRPREKEQGKWYSLAEIMKQIKGSSAIKVNQVLGRSGTLWQPEYFDRLIRDENELHEKWLYMWNNPLKAGLADSFDEYKFYIWNDDSQEYTQDGLKSVPL
jgi:REP element-mobilizing transposase RayT